MTTQIQTINTVADFIQLSVSPAFLLAGVAGLLNVFTGRMARIIDRLERIDNYYSRQKTLEDKRRAEQKFFKKRTFLIRRMKNINHAILLCTITGFFISIVIATMFLSSLFAFRDFEIISFFYILAMISLVLSLFLFLREIYFTTSYIKIKKEPSDINF